MLASSGRLGHSETAALATCARRWSFGRFCRAVAPGTRYRSGWAGGVCRVHSQEGAADQVGGELDASPSALHRHKRSIPGSLSPVSSSGAATGVENQRLWLAAAHIQSKDTLNYVVDARSLVATAFVTCFKSTHNLHTEGGYSGGLH